jgi:hypothetical protein
MIYNTVLVIPNSITIKLSLGYLIAKIEVYMYLLD